MPAGFPDARADTQPAGTGACSYPLVATGRDTKATAETEKANKSRNEILIIIVMRKLCLIAFVLLGLIFEIQAQKLETINLGRIGVRPQVGPSPTGTGIIFMFDYGNLRGYMADRYNQGYTCQDSISDRLCNAPFGQSTKKGYVEDKSRVRGKFTPVIYIMIGFCLQ